MTPAKLAMKQLLAVWADALRDAANLDGRVRRATNDASGGQHPAYTREAHAQMVMASAVGRVGCSAVAEGQYFVPRSKSRRIDLVVWVPDVARWWFVEVKPCGPLEGHLPVDGDAQKLVADAPSDPRDLWRGVVAYGFRSPVRSDSFPRKYRQGITNSISVLGFDIVDVVHRPLLDGRFDYVQVGAWSIGTP